MFGFERCYNEEYVSKITIKNWICGIRPNLATINSIQMYLWIPVWSIISF